VQCDVRLPALTPASFSFNTPQGACSVCDGLGFAEDFDPELIVPNPQLSLREGAILPWAHRHSVHFLEYLDALTAHFGTDVFTPFEQLPPAFTRVLLYGSGEEKIPFFVERDQRRTIHRRPFEGLIPRLRRRWAEAEGHRALEEIRRYMRARPCSACQGTRLNPVAGRVEVGGTTLPELCALSAAEARDHLRRLPLSGQSRQIADKLISEIDSRLSFLVDVGLPYLTLDRSAATLSGGENQRIRLATQIGSKLTGVLYVLDEPSIGLHPRDHQRLLLSLQQMRDLGNTVLVVEHDRETIQTADHVVDMGPGAGVNGGQVVFSGPPQELLEAPQSLTGAYLSGRRAIPVPLKRRIRGDNQLILEGAWQNNLQHITVHFPLGQLICVTGVSGSGKSTLVLETLYPALAQKLYRASAPVAKHRRLQGVSFVDKVIHIDQSPIGKTPRSNPGTYTGLFALIRDLFARTPEARARGYKSGRFSFNVKGGRCEACRGDGILKIEMHFLPDLHVTCDACQGRRYNRETLEVKYKGCNIVEVLDMTVNQALSFFERMPNFRSKLETLIDVGLGYLRIGQPATTLSGGESQRIKLSRELSRRATGRTVYILDEPTTGLHFHDVHHLLGILQRLVDAGNTVIVIEHNLEVVKCADYIIDLGPEGGEEGGRVVATGTPEVLAQNPTSHTGRFLRGILARSHSAAGERDAEHQTPGPN
jgi:excinuclease ABC subunit A